MKKANIFEDCYIKSFSWDYRKLILSFYKFGTRYKACYIYNKKFKNRYIDVVGIL